MKAVYFKDIESDAIYAPMGTWGSDGIFWLRHPNGSWEFLSPNSFEWDAVHQQIYRNHRVEVVDIAELAFSLPELPAPPERAEQPFPWKEQLLPKRPTKASTYPLIKKMLEAKKDRTVTVFVVLDEDAYESIFGDGEFHYLKKLFLAKKDADQYIRRKQSEWKRFHLRTITIKLDGEVLSFESFEARLYDHHKAVDVLRSLERRLGK